MDGLDASRRGYNVKTGEIITEGDRARGRPSKKKWIEVIWKDVRAC